MRTKAWWELAAGLAGGLLGTAAMVAGMKRSSKLPESLRPPAPSQDPGDYMVSLAERLTGRQLPGQLHGQAAHGLQWAYGSVWPLALGAMARRLGVRSPGRALAAGAILGVVVWSVGALGWLPATGLTPPIHRQRPGGAVANLLGHVTYGTVAALPLAMQTRIKA
jgi:hypothetical protein